MNETEIISQHVAEMLLRTKAVTLSPDDPYTWSSGLRSPIYCDNRVTLSDVIGRFLVTKGLSKFIRENFPQINMVAGVSTAGIAQGAYVADSLELPYCYVRPEPKLHGKGKQIEGRLIPNARTVVVEDLISTGGSSLKVVHALRDAGAEANFMVSIFTYGFEKAKNAFAEANVKLYSLTDYPTLINIAVQQQYITRDQMLLLQDWSKDPQLWSDNYTASIASQK